MNITESKIEDVPVVDEKDPQLLKRRIDAINDLGVVRERANIAIISSVIDSRLLKPDASGQQGLGLKISGIQGTGKSYLVDSCVKLQDSSAYHSISNGSDKSLFYHPKNSMKNMALILGEALKLEKESQFGYTIRILLSEGKATHQVTKSIGKGNFQTVDKVVEGPLSLITTTTCATLEKQIESRLITVSPDESSKQTRAIMKRVAELASKGVINKDQNLIKAWQRFHKDLKPGRVVIPFATEIERKLNTQDQLVPMIARRSFKHLLSLIRAIAIFYQSQRQKNEHTGEIVAEIADYHMAHQMLSEVFEEKMEFGSEIDKERIKLIADASTNTSKLLQAKDLTKEWGISKQAVTKWLKPKIKDGIIEWCKANGKPFNGDQELQTAKHSGNAYLKISKTFRQNNLLGMVMPTAYDLFQDESWKVNGEKANLYDLQLN